MSSIFLKVDEESNKTEVAPPTCWQQGRNLHDMQKSLMFFFWQSQALQYFILVRHILGLILFSYLASHN